MKNWIAAGLVASLALACRAPSAQRIEPPFDLLDQLIAADNAGDVERVMACYSSSPILMPPNEAAVEGRDAVRARYAMAFTNYRFEFTSHAFETHASGDIAWLRGETHGRLISKTGGDDIAAHDKFLMTLERDSAGAWHVARLMWSAAGDH